MKDFLIGPFEDYPGNPILKPLDRFYSKGIYNPSALKEGKRFYMFFRAESDDGLTGRIGMAESDDGFHFTCRNEPLINPEDDFDRLGCEDPRIVKIGDTYYLTYVGNSGRYNISNICIATSKDLIGWKKQGPVLKSIKGSWCAGQIKAGVIVPERIGERYVMYFMGEERPWRTAIGIAYSDDLINWYEGLDKPLITPRAGYFDSEGVEPGPTPLLVEEGILLIYNGWSEDCIYKPGGILLSKEDPSKILRRTEGPLLIPSKDYGYEFGTGNHCVAEGLVRDENRWLLYYGAADRLCCVAIYEEGKG